MPKKIISLIFLLSLVSASCNIFNPAPEAGVVKTTNGGTDWQFVDAIKDNQNASLKSVSISSMAFDPRNREVVFAGSYTEGLYKSTDSGSSWSKVLSKILVYDFAIHPNDSNIIYAAGYFGGFGKVLMTRDGGGSWLEIYNEQSEENPVRSIAISPNDPRQVVIGTSAGSIIRSMDEGLSWKLVRNLDDRVNRIFWRGANVYVLTRTKGLHKGPEPDLVFQNTTHDMARGSGNLDNRIQSFHQHFIDPSNESLQYVTTNRGLYRSQDAGTTWQYVTLPIQPDAAMTRAIAVPAMGSNTVYTSVGSTIYKTTDSGVSWQTQKIPTNGFVNYILIDPALPQIAYAGIYGE